MRLVSEAVFLSLTRDASIKPNVHRIAVQQDVGLIIGSVLFSLMVDVRRLVTEKSSIYGPNPQR
jgi:hypothetical protein